jgi:hypothetical protein
LFNAVDDTLNLFGRFRVLVGNRPLSIARGFDMTTHRTGFGHPDCYARALKDCCTEITGEHAVPESMLKAVALGNKAIEISGKAWQNLGASQVIGIKRLVANILCERHNCSLSGFDQAGLALFEVIDDLHERFLALDVCRVHELDGPAIERCLLKILCGGIVSGDMADARGVIAKDWTPPIEWLRILFENSAFPKGCGMYVLVKKKGTVEQTTNQILRTGALFGPKRAVCGLKMSLFYFDFVLVMDSPLRFAPEQSLAGACYRPRTLLFNDLKGTKETTLTFKWGGHPFSDVTIVTTILSQQPP